MVEWRQSRYLVVSEQFLPQTQVKGYGLSSCIKNIVLEFIDHSGSDKLNALKLFIQCFSIRRSGLGAVMGDKIESPPCLKSKPIEKEFECLSHERRCFCSHQGIATKVRNPARPLPAFGPHERFKLLFTDSKNIIDFSRVRYNSIR